MAIGAGQGRVRSGKRITGVFQMVELGAKPTIHGVATLAGSRESGGDVVNHRGQKVLLMAGEASRGQPQELTHCGALMALVALHQGVRAHKRKAILVILDRIE